MSLTVTRNGSQVRVVALPRVVTSFANVGGRLVVTFDDLTTQDIGLYPSGPPVTTYMMDFRSPANARYLGAVL